MDLLTRVNVLGMSFPRMRLPTRPPPEHTWVAIFRSSEGPYGGYPGGGGGRTPRDTSHSLQSTKGAEEPVSPDGLPREAPTPARADLELLPTPVRDRGLPVPAVAVLRNKSTGAKKF
jgi:hypothetical protein